MFDKLGTNLPWGLVADRFVQPVLAELSEYSELLSRLLALNVYSTEDISRINLITKLYASVSTYTRVGVMRMLLEETRKGCTSIDHFEKIMQWAALHR